MERRTNRGRGSGRFVCPPIRIAAIALMAMPFGLHANEEVKFSQPPTAGEGSIAPSNVELGDVVPNVVVADDFLSDGRRVDAVRWWGSVLPERSFGPLFGVDPCGPTRGEPDFEFEPGILVVDPDTGAATRIGPGASDPWTEPVTEIEWTPDGTTLYATSGYFGVNTIWELDPNTGLILTFTNYFDFTPEPPTGMGNLTGMEYYCPGADPADCVLLGAFFPWDFELGEPAATSKLVIVNPDAPDPPAGVLTEIGEFLFPADPPAVVGPVGGLAFDADGTLYGIISGPWGGHGIGVEDFCIGSGDGGGEPPTVNLLELTLLEDPETQELLGVEVTRVIPTDIPKRASSLEFLPQPDGRLIAGAGRCLYQITIQEDGNGDPIFGLATEIGPHVNYDGGDEPALAAGKLSGLSVRPNASPPEPFGKRDEPGCQDGRVSPCGDGVIDEGEQCDPPNGVDCNSECQLFAHPAGEIDGWLIGFHEPQEPKPQPLGLYFCDASVVTAGFDAVTVCDEVEADMDEYYVDLADCCLIDSNADSRSGSVPAQVGRFEAAECDYKISIQAVRGWTYRTSNGCQREDTFGTAEGDFWGWHASETDPQAVDDFLSVSTSVTVENDELVYGEWDDAAYWCGSRGNLAFELITTESYRGGRFEVVFDPDPDLTITDCSEPAGPAWVHDERTISAECNPIVDLDVEVHIAHWAVGDLIVLLSHDDETTNETVTLICRLAADLADVPDEDCGGGYVDTASLAQGLDVTFDDLASVSVHNAADPNDTTPVSGRYRPFRGVCTHSDALSSFTGMNRCGVWTLSVQDALSFYEGELTSWSLHFADPGTPPRHDCNANGMPDECELSLGESVDVDLNGILDDCETAKSRYLYVEVNELSATEILDQPTAIGVRLTSLHRPQPSCSAGGDPDFSYFDEVGGCDEPIDPDTGAGGCVRWIGPPSVVPGRTAPVSSDPGSYFVASGLQCEPFVMDWSTVAQLQVYGAEILPSSEYEVQPGDPECMAVGTCPAPILVLGTAHWGDILDPGADRPAECANVLDIAELVDGLKELAGAFRKPRTQLQPNAVNPSENISVLDIASTVDAVKDKPYELPPMTGPCACPSVVVCPDTDACGRCLPPPPRGVCCLETGQCREWTEEECLAELNAEYRGDWTECHLEDCTPPPPAARVRGPRPVGRGF